MMNPPGGPQPEFGLIKWSSSSTSPLSFVTTPVTETVKVTWSVRVMNVRACLGSTFHVFETRFRITACEFSREKGPRCRGPKVSSLSLSLFE
jgi:hypothetical protein